MKYLGIDYGKKYVGIAVSDEKGEFAFPYKVLKNNARLLDAIQSIIVKEKIGEIVIGESRNYKGEKNMIMAEIDQFAKKLGGTGLGVHFEPEYLTSREATHIQGETQKIHASAAALILSSFLNKRNNKESYL